MRNGTQLAIRHSSINTRYRRLAKNVACMDVSEALGVTFLVRLWAVLDSRVVERVPVSVHRKTSRARA